MSPVEARVGATVVGKVPSQHSFSSALPGLTSPVLIIQTLCVLGTGAILIPRLMKIAVQAVDDDVAMPRRWLYRALWSFVFIVNLIAVSIDGRFDSDTTRTAASNRDDKSGTILTFTPVFAPAGWAFAIWGVIYLGETLLTAVVALPLEGYTSFLKHATPFWVGANLFQSLWCACFRHRFKNMLWLPSMCLIAAAFCQTRCLYMIMETIDIPSYSATTIRGVFDYATNFPLTSLGRFVAAFPVALHAGWLMAAALLNVNSWVTESGATLGQNVAMAFFSTYFAAALGAFASIKTRNPFVMATIAWALAAVASNTRKNEKVQAAKLDEVTREALYITEKQVSNALLASAFILQPVVNAIQEQLF